MEYFRSRKKRLAVAGGGREVRGFSYEEVEAASCNFAPSTFLGRGSHGSVFRATFENGRLLAAAKLINAGDASDPSNEIEILSAIRNPRIVNLLGYAPGNIAVVELMPNGSLHDHLHGQDRTTPTWARRLRWLLEVAEAVLALHTLDPPIIHRDIKPSNVLVDGEGGARLGDFGLAVRVSGTSNPPPPAGTIGYIDPSYLVAGDVSVKTDVYSFGVVMLEMLTGRRAIDVDYSPPSVLDWAMPKMAAGEFDEIWDGRVRRVEDKERSVLKEVAVLAMKCVAGRTEERPEMREVVDKLTVADRRFLPPVGNRWVGRIWKAIWRRKTYASRRISDVAN